MKDIKNFINEGNNTQQYEALEKSLLGYATHAVPELRDISDKSNFDSKSVKSVVEDCWNIIYNYMDEHNFDWSKNKEISEFDDKLRELFK